MKWFKHTTRNNTAHRRNHVSSLNRELFMVACFVLGIVFVRTNFVQSETVSLSQNSWMTLNETSATELPADNWGEYSAKDAGIVTGESLSLESASYAVIQTSDDGVTDTCDTANCSAGGGFNAAALKTQAHVVGTGADASINLTADSLSNNIIQNLVGSYDTGNAEGLAISGTTVYVADKKNGLQIVDISDPANPTLAGTYIVSGTATRVALKGKNAYVITDDANDLQIVKINKPDKLKLTGTYAVSGIANDIAISGKHAYVVAEDPLGLQILDISTPETPTLAGSFAITGTPKAIALSGKYAYIASDDKFDLQIVKVNKLSNIKLVGKLKITGGKIENIAVSGNYAYVTGNNSGLNIIDISDPKNPALVGSYTTEGKAKGVAVAGNFAYVAMNDFGMATLNVAIPSVPALVATYDSPGKAKNVLAVGNTAYIADAKEGLQIVQTTESSNYYVAGIFESAAMDLGSNVYELDALIADIEIPAGSLPVGTEINAADSGLLGLWRMNTDNSADTIVTDPVGSNNGTLHTAASGTNASTSAMWDEAGNLGSTMYTAMEFDGTDDYVSVDNFMTGIQAIVFWINHGSPTSGDEILEFNGSQSISIAEGTGDITTTGLTLPTIYVNGSTSSTALSTGWHHVAIVTGTPITGSDMNLGRVVTGYMAGLLDEVAVYNRQLSANEIYAMYQGSGVKFQVAASDCLNGANNAPDCTTFIGWGDNDTPFTGDDGTGNTFLKGPRALYHFDEGSGTTLNDVSGFGHHGTLNIGGSGSQTNEAESWLNATEQALVNLGSQGLALDGTDDYISVGNLDADIKTVELWINHNSNNFGGVILELSPTHAIVITTSGIVTATGFESPSVYVNGSTSSSALSAGWHHVAVVTNTGVSASGVNIGKVGSQYTAGSLDEIAMYDWAMSGGAVRARYNNGLGKKGGAFGGISNADLNNKQYVKFKAFMSTSSMFYGPKINDVMLGVSAFPAGAGLVSSSFDTGNDNNFLTDISWSESLNGHDVRVQVATSADNIKWNYCGSFDCSTNDWLDFTGTAGSYYTVATGSSPNVQSRNADQDRYIKYKIWLMSTDGTTAPTVDDITISYDTAHLEVYAPDGASSSYEPTAQTPFNIVVKVMDSSGVETKYHDGSRSIKLTASSPQPNTEGCISSFSENGNTELSQSVVFFSGQAIVSNVLLCDSSVSGGFTISAVETIGGALSSTADLTITNIKDSDETVSATLYWDALDDCTNFDHYEVWYGMTSNVTRGIGLVWDDKSDAAMAVCSTETTTITDLLPDIEYYFNLFAIDTDGNAIAMDLSDSPVDDDGDSDDLTEDSNSPRPAGAMLYDVVVKLGDNHHSDPQEDARGSYKHGDVVAIMPNGHVWSENEKRSFLIVQMYLTPEERDDLTAAEVDVDGNVVSRRANHIDMTALGLTEVEVKDEVKKKNKRKELRGKRLKKKKAMKAKRRAEREARRAERKAAKEADRGNK